jgi:ABC-type antimicrobial peptide transport system permease subunit
VKKQNLFRIALFNIRARKATTLKIFAGFLFMCMLLTVVATYDIAINVFYEKILAKGSALNCIEIRHSYPSVRWVELPEADIKYLSEIDGVREVKTEGRTIIFSSINYRVIIDGQTVSSPERYISSFDIMYSLEPNVVAKNEVTEFQVRHPNRQIVYGKSAVGEGEIVVSYGFVRQLGLGVYDVLEKTLTVIPPAESDPDGSEVKPFPIQNLKIVGVLSPLYDELKFKVLTETRFYIYASPTDGDDYLSTALYLDGFRTGRDIFLKVRGYLNERGLLNGVDGYVALMYYAGQAGEKYVTFEDEQELVNSVLNTVGALLIAALAVNLVVILFYDVKRKGIYFGVLKACGMSPREILSIIFLELFFIFLAAAVISITVTSLLVELIGGYTADKIEVALTLDLKQYALIGLGILVGGVISLLSLSWLLLKSHMKQDPVRLL